jgi:hypothetical protein
MRRFRKGLVVLTLLLGTVLFLGTPATAQADFWLVVQDVDKDGYVVGEQRVTSSTSSILNFSSMSFGAWELVIATSLNNQAFGTSQAYLHTDVISLKLLGTTDHTLRVIASVQDFEFPSNPLHLTSHLGGSNTVGPSGSGATITFQSFADPVNSLLGVTTDYAAEHNKGNMPAGQNFTSFAGSPGAVTTGLQQTTNSTFPEDVTLSFNRNGGYSLTNVTTFSNMVAGQVISTNAETFVTSPAPPGLVLVLSGLSVLGLRRVFQRRKAPTGCFAAT